MTAPLTAVPGSAWDNVVCERSTMDEASKLELFEQTMVPHLNAAYNLARWLTRNRHDAEDLVQEAYLRAFRFFDGFDPTTAGGGDGRAWLLAVVRNTCLTWLGRKTGGASATVEFNEQAHGTADDAENAEEILVRNAKIASLRNCVESLPVEYREVIVMRELEEMSYREIAEVARVPVGTVMSRLSRVPRVRLLDCTKARRKHDVQVRADVNRTISGWRTRCRAECGGGAPSGRVFGMFGGAPEAGVGFAHRPASAGAALRCADATSLARAEQRAPGIGKEAGGGPLAGRCISYRGYRVAGGYRLAGT